jgi:colanic acid/amylovoran biosynthesis glycosyltransferase
MGRRTLVARGVDPARIALVRRGLEVFPEFKSLRSPRRPLRLICVARLVPKKGLRAQLQIYAAARAAGLDFVARLVGDGELRRSLEAEAAGLGLAERIEFTGEVPPAAVWDHLRWADVLLHTGVITPTGDRDGLPNVIPEAMATGTLVLTSSVAAATEAIHPEETGIVADVDRPQDWVAALRRLCEDDVLAEQMRRAARAWVEENYSASRNAERLEAWLERTVRAGEPAP